MRGGVEGPALSGISHDDSLVDVEFDEEETALGRWAYRLRLTSWPVQTFLSVLTFTHCVSYYFQHWGHYLNQTSLELWMLGTGPTLIPFLLVEIAAGIAVEGGPLWRLRSWVRFLKPLYRKTEVFILLGTLYCLSMSLSLHLLYPNLLREHNDGGSMFVQAASAFLTLEDDEIVKTILHSDQMTVAALSLHRAMRIWGIYFGVSTKATEEFRLRLDDPKALWMQDYTLQKERHEEKCLVRLERLMDSWYMQVFMLFFVSCPVFMHYYFHILRGMDFYRFVRPVAYSSFACVALDFFLHCTAQGGEGYFIPRLHVFETLILGFDCLLFLVMWHRYPVEEIDILNTPAGVISLSLVVQRLLHIIGLLSGVSGKWSSLSVLDGQAHRIFTNLLGDLLEVPPTNLQLGVGSGFKFRVQKASVKCDCLGGLHMPVSLRGGLLEDLTVSLPRPDSLNEKAVEEATILRVSQLVLVLGPGDGLGEAGGIADVSNPIPQYWTYESVLEAKARLVELISKRLRPRSKNGADRERGRESGLNRLFRRLRSHIKGLAQESSLRNVTVEIDSVAIQFEDPGGELGYNGMVIGACLGKVMLHRRKERFVRCDFIRVGVYVQDNASKQNRKAPIPPSKDQVWTLEPLGTDQRRSRLGELLRSDPKQAVAELMRINNLERFRTWSMDFLEERNQLETDLWRHRLLECWQEQRWIFRLRRLKLRAEPTRKNRTRGAGKSVACWVVSTGVNQPKSMHMVIWRFFTWLCRFAASSVKAVASAEQRPPEEEAKQDWSWQVNIRPVQLGIDDRQAQCLIRLSSCLKMWLALDRVMRWRPVPRLREPEDSLANDQGAAARMWWNYAVRRVCALRRLKFSCFMMDMSLRTHSMLAYQAVLQELADRQSKHKANHGSKSRKRRRSGTLSADWEDRWVKELQMHLAIRDIIDCRRQVVVRAPPQVAQKPHERIRMALRMRDSRGNEDESEELNQRLNSLTVVQGFSEKGKDTEESGSRTTVSSWFAGSQDQRDVSTSSTSSDERCKDLQAFQNLVDNFAGHWGVDAPRIDVRVLRHGTLPRSMVLHIGMSSASASAVVFSAPFTDAQRFDMDPASAREVAVSLSVGGIRASCPDAGPLLLGTHGRHICTVAQLAHPNDRRGFPAFEPDCMAVAMRVGMPAINGDHPGLFELHTPAIRVIVHQPLLRWFKRLTTDKEWLAQDEVRPTLEVKEGSGKRVMLPRRDTDVKRRNEGTPSQMRRRLHGVQKFFEWVTGINELRPEWDVELMMGELEVLRVEEYTRTDMAVEQFRVETFSASGTRSKPLLEESINDEGFTAMPGRRTFRDHHVELSSPRQRRDFRDPNDTAAERPSTKALVWMESDDCVDDDMVHREPTQASGLAPDAGADPAACSCSLWEPLTREPMALAAPSEASRFSFRVNAPKEFLDLAHGTELLDWREGSSTIELHNRSGLSAMRFKLQVTILPRETGLLARELEVVRVHLPPVAGVRKPTKLRRRDPLKLVSI